MQDLLFDRIRNILLGKEVNWVEKKMMGGITFMVDDKMCFGTLNGGLLCRIDPLERDQLLSDPNTEIIKQAGREMKGYVHVQPAGYESDEELAFWTCPLHSRRVGKCLDFNPRAKESKSRK